MGSKSQKYYTSGDQHAFSIFKLQYPTIFQRLLKFVESAPICETIFTTTDNDSLSVSRHLLMRCSITFRGFWTPTLEWRRHDGNGNNSRVWKKITDATVEVSRFTNNTITSTLAVRINESEKYSHFSCQISFANYDGNDKSVTATNVPDFFYFWNSDVAPRLGAEVCSTTSSALCKCGCKQFAVLE